jgi:predicted nucleic acid-binding protein
MMFLLDTDVVSEFRKLTTGKMDSHVDAWARNVPEFRLFLSSVCVFEIEKGVLRMERLDRRHGAALRKWFDGYILPSFEGRILDFDTVVARRCAALHVPDPRSERDAMIAATALVHSMTVVTRHVTDFEPMGVPVLNPWLA